MRVPPAAIYFPPEDRAEILAQIDEALSTGQLTLGKLGKEFEERFAGYVGSQEAVAVSSGTSALEIVLRTLDPAGRDVLVPANTFFATAAAIIAAGGRPRFVDCDPATMSLRPDHLRELISDQTAAVVVVHIGGLVTPAIGEIQSVCAYHGVPLVEDAAHAHGSAHGGRRAGTFGVAGTFSFYPTKVMAGGEGGVIVTDDERIASEARIYRDQGKASFLTNLHTRLGSNWRMSEPHAAIVLSQLGRLDEFIERRQHVAKTYDAAIDTTGLTPLVVPDEGFCNYYKYVAFLPTGVDRTALKKLLRDDYEVGLSGEVYDTPLHQQPVFEQWAEGTLPGAEWLCANHVCLPVFPTLTDEQADWVIESLHSAIGRL
jgi:dTDP-4-amino-4,6-dideoxygalactose transaminase